MNLIERSDINIPKRGPRHLRYLPDHSELRWSRPHRDHPSSRCQN